MDLKIRDVAELLQVSEKTIYRWIKEKTIPVYQINHQYRFNRAEINEWILRNKINVSNRILDLNQEKKPVSLVKLLQKGGIFYKIEGETVKEIIHNAVNIMPTPQELSKEAVISSLLEREGMMPTAMGHGIAFPHPRNPIIADVEDECIFLCFLHKSIEYGAIDGEPVHSLFFLITANPRRHLEILSKLSYLCQQKEFIHLLKSQVPRGEIVSYIQEQEGEWKQKEGERE